MPESTSPKSSRGRDLFDYLHGGTPQRGDRLYRLPLPEESQEEGVEQTLSALHGRVQIVGSAVVREAGGSAVFFEVRRRQSEERMRKLAKSGFEGLAPAA